MHPRAAEFFPHGESIMDSLMLDRCIMNSTAYFFLASSESAVMSLVHILNSTVLGEYKQIVRLSCPTETRMQTGVLPLHWGQSRCARRWFCRDSLWGEDRTDHRWVWITSIFSGGQMSVLVFTCVSLQFEELSYLSSWMLKWWELSEAGQHSSEVFLRACECFSVWPWEVSGALQRDNSTLMRAALKLCGEAPSPHQTAQYATVHLFILGLSVWVGTLV